jgi:hypothetical protein
MQPPLFYPVKEGLHPHLITHVKCEPLIFFTIINLQLNPRNPSKRRAKSKIHIKQTKQAR